MAKVNHAGSGAAEVPLAVLQRRYAAGEITTQEELGFCRFLVIAVFLLWKEHGAHVLGAAPYVLLLPRPIIIPRPGRQARAKSPSSSSGVTV